MFAMAPSIQKPKNQIVDNHYEINISRWGGEEKRGKFVSIHWLQSWCIIVLCHRYKWPPLIHLSLSLSLNFTFLFNLIILSMPIQQNSFMTISHWIFVIAFVLLRLTFHFGLSVMNHVGVCLCLENSIK